MKKQTIFLTLLTALSALQGEPLAQKSVTGNSTPYREICARAATDDEIFAHFRSIEPYFNAVECGQGGEFADYLRIHATAKTLSCLKKFSKLDTYGTPVRNQIPGFGLFSGTTLRYVLVADHISRLFDLPPKYSVAEIGAGFGGQAYILSTLLPCARYYIYDLPEVESLIERMMSTLSLSHVHCLEAHAELPQKQVDLFISNYAFSECDRPTQLDYFQRVIVKAKRGYMLFNDTNPFEHLSLSEFIDLLQTNGIRPTIHQEPVFTYTGNVLITWDKTKE